MSNPVTIVIPAYNRADTLPRTLRSIERQTLAPSRVVLVDNASTDSTFALMSDWAAAHPDLDVIVLREEKRGACAARNRGLREVESDFVMFFDSDDEMLPTHVADFTTAIEKSPDTDIFGRSIISRNLDGSSRKLYFTARNPMFNHLFRGCLSTQRIVVRTSLARMAGGWNETLPVWNDFEFGLRLLLLTERVEEVAGEPSVIAYQQAESITGTSFSAKAGQWERTLDMMEADFIGERRYELLKWLDCRRMILAAHYRLENSPELAEQLRRKTLDGNPHATRLHLIYAHNLRFRRLTWLCAKILFCF